MDQVGIRNAAQMLQQVLAKYTTSDQEARYLEAGVRPLIEKALAGQIEAPMELRDVPGGYWFNEGSLRQYPELENSFVKFRIELSGGYTPIRRALLDKINAIKVD